MKKIALVTVFDIVNIGTYLQTLALGEILKANDCEVNVVNYIRPMHTWQGIIKRYFKIGVVKALYYFVFKFSQMLVLRKKNKQFIQKYLFLSKEYTSFEKLKNNPPEADIYLTGSDQVWNSQHNRGIEHSYYLNFAPIDKPRIAYAASIGMEDFPENEKNEIRDLLAKYVHISVREKQAKQIMENLGIQNSEVVLDPTLLLSKNDWISLVDISCFKKKEPYLLVYSVESKKQNELIKQIAKQIAKEKNLAIYSVSYQGKIRNQMNFADRCFTRSTPELFLSLFAQADFTVVSSFHGTAFSVNFNKEFVSVAPAQFNSRVDSLLSLVDLKDRIIANTNSDILNLKVIDYNAVNQILDIEREKSIAYLRRAIN